MNPVSSTPALATEQVSGTVSTPELAIQARNLSKRYQIYQQPIDRLKQSFRIGGKNHYQDFWALKDVSFDVRRGEIVGIVGVNGSGKSTLLQILAGTLTPSDGDVQVQGRVHALLELGAGFNPHFTGRQNVYLNGTLWGLTREEIDASFDKIAAFADIGPFLDQQVRLYSSGMYVRLAFAMHAVLPKEVFIVDEALAVGDELFQRKCFSSLQEFHENGGTVLFVSHSAALVKELCNRAIFLDSGELIAQGNCKTVVDQYQRFLFLDARKKAEYREQLKAGRDKSAGHLSGGTVPSAGALANGEIADAGADDGSDTVERDLESTLQTTSRMVYPEQGASISDVRIETRDGRTVNVLNQGEKYILRYNVRFEQDCENVLFGTLIKTPSGLELGGTANDRLVGGGKKFAAGTEVAVAFEFSPCLLHGIYFANCGVTGRCGNYDGFLARIVDVLAFRVRQRIFRHVTGFVDFEFSPQVRQVA